MPRVRLWLLFHFLFCNYILFSLAGKHDSDPITANARPRVECLGDDRLAGLQGAETRQSGGDQVHSRPDVPDGRRPGAAAIHKAPAGRARSCHHHHRALRPPARRSRGLHPGQLRRQYTGHVLHAARDQAQRSSWAAADTHGAGELSRRSSFRGPIPALICK